ncbi:MAG TPA: serine protease [Gammaproteobacteria bacterium]|nr:serine protease [Gammaproteobacteria bacterium]
MSKFRNVLLASMASLLITACGGGSSSGNPPPLTDPVAVSAAAYAIVAVYQNPTTNKTFNTFVGTSFAIRDRLLATNSHITEWFNLQKNPLPAGFQMTKVYAVQSGTGNLFTLTRALTHPKYSGDPLGSPDVGLLTTVEILPSTLALASVDEANAISLGDTLFLSGFPADVDEFFTIVPGTTVPQATNLTGAVTAFRNFNPNVVVGTDNIDVIQHQVPTTPGTSGSPLVKNGKVIAANNAGTITSILQVDPATGQATVGRTAAAANNFGIHVRYLHELISLFDDNSIQGFELPPTALGSGGQPPPPAATQQFSGNYQGSSTTPGAEHSIAFSIAANNAVTGTSSWPGTGSFNLAGGIDTNGNIVMQDDALNSGLRTGVYVGQINVGTGQVTGVYDELDNLTGQPVGNNVTWSAQKL